MKKSIITAIACTLVTGAAIIGAVTVFAGKGDSEQPINVDSEITTEESKVYLQFSPVKRILGDIDTIREQTKKEDNAELTRRIVEKLGYDPRSQKEPLDENTFAELCKIGSDFENDKIYNILEKLLNDGYGNFGTDDIKYFVYVTKDYDFEENVGKYCNIIMMTVNAYNDPDYEISDTDRVRILDFLEGAYSALTEYGVIGKENGKFIMSVDEIPEQVTTAKEAASKTVYAEYGRMPLGLNT